jgi:hypothetical protein
MDNILASLIFGEIISERRGWATSERAMIIMMRASRMIAQATLLLLLAASAYNTVQGTPLAHCLQPKGPGGLFNSTLPRCEDGQTSHIDPNSRVAVIGGGPAGTMMAKLLNDRGIKATTLLSLLSVPRTTAREYACTRSARGHDHTECARNGLS